MPKAEIRVVSMRAPVTKTGVNFFDGNQIVNTCSNSKEAWSSDLSPFLLGPCYAQDEWGDPYTSMNFENLWQYSKVYAAVKGKIVEHLDINSNPSKVWWKWAKEGWSNMRAVRFPMGRGARPQYSYWRKQKLSYVAARKAIYAPQYADLVTKTKGFAYLKQLVEANEGTIFLRDFDGYDEVEKNMTLTQVLNNPNRKMGHAFVLKMLLTEDAAIQQFGPL